MVHPAKVMDCTQLRIHMVVGLGRTMNQDVLQKQGPRSWALTGPLWREFKPIKISAGWHLGYRIILAENFAAIIVQ